MLRSDRGETERPARAAVTVALLTPAACAKSARFHPRRATSRSRVSVRTIIPITRYSVWRQDG